LNCVKLNRTKIQLIEETSERDIVNEEIIAEMFNFLAESVENPRLEKDVNDALITLCGNWSDFVTKNFNNFIQCKYFFHFIQRLI